VAKSADAEDQNPLSRKGGAGSGPALGTKALDASMTLILTRASRDYVLQVADRLVTLPGGQPFDAMSNKTVLYCARNGVVTMGYTGLAYLGGIPTDQWIVQTLIGSTLELGPSGAPAIRLGGAHGSRHRPVAYVAKEGARRSA